ncbi:MAG TPA: DUF2510 domain-containing protein [Galbitalea sp.]
MSGDIQPSVPPSIPAGWYPDPAGGNGKRWWDGRSWTQNVQVPDTPQAAPSFGGFIPAADRPVTPLPTAEAGIGYTRASWWIASSPLWVVVPQAAVFGALNALGPVPAESYELGTSLFTALALAILIALAFADRAALRRGGNDTAASPWWMLLSSLAYLIARARQVQLYASGGWASVLWWVLAAVVSPGVGVLAIFAVYGLV